MLPFPTIFPKGLRQGRTEHGESWGPEMDANLRRLDATVLHAFAPDIDNTTGLTLALFGGYVVSSSTGRPIAVAPQTVTLTDNTTNYVERDADGVAHVVATQFTIGRVSLCVVTTRNGRVEAITDARLTVGTASGGTSVTGVINIVDRGADPTGTVDSEPAIQAVYDEVDAMDEGAGRPVILWPPGRYKVNRPIRIKSGPMVTKCQNPATFATQLFGPGHGPLMVVYPAHATNDLLTPAYVDAAEEMVTALLTGAGSAWEVDPPLISGSGWSFYRWSYYNLRETCAVELDGLGKLTVDLTLKYLAGQHSSYGTVIQSYGSMCSGEPVTSAFGITIQSGKVVANLTTAVASYSLQSTTTLVAGSVYHIALVFAGPLDGNLFSLYINGVSEASTGTGGYLQQSPYEEVTIGKRIGNFPEAMDGADAAIVQMDSVRLSNSVRYTATFTAPTAKSTLDANTMILLNFDEQYDTFTVARTNTGDAHLFVRHLLPDTGVEYADKVLIEGLTWEGIFATANSYRAGLLTTHAIQCHLECCSYQGRGMYGVFHRRDSYLSSSRLLRSSIFNPGRIPLALERSGVYNAQSPSLTAGVTQLATSAGSVRVIDPWIQTEPGTVAPYLVESGGEGGELLAIYGGGVSCETGAPDLRAAVMIGSGLVNWWGGVVEHQDNHVAELNDNSRINLFATFCGGLSTGGEPIIKLNGNRSYAYLFGAQKLYGNQGITNPRAWTDRPENTFIAGNLRVRPVVHGRTVYNRTSGEDWAPDCALADTFVLRVYDSAALTIGTPVKGKSGQVITITVENHSGGIMGATTWGIGYSMATWTNPLNLYAHSITFRFTGVSWEELSRTPTAFPWPNITPSTLADLELHLNAGSLGLADNDPVTTWLDETANNNDFAQATGSLQPVFKTNIVNSLPVVRFDGTDDRMTAADSASLQITGPHSFFAVVRGDSFPANDSYTNAILTKGPAASLSYGWCVTVSRYFAENVNDGVTGGAIYDIRNLVPVNQFVLVEVVYDGTEYKVYVNGVGGFTVNLNSVGDPADNSPLGMILGGEPSTIYAPWDGDIAELALYSRGLGDDERLQLEFYFSEKYALGLTFGDADE